MKMIKIQLNLYIIELNEKCCRIKYSLIKIKAFILQNTLIFNLFPELEKFLFI